MSLKRFLLFLIILLTFLFGIYEFNRNYDYYATDDFFKNEPDVIFTTINQNRLLNLNNFTYLIDNTICKYNVSSIQIVTSYAGNVEARSYLRRSYDFEKLLNLGIVRVFLLAKLDDGHEIKQAALEDENKRFNDLIQGNFDEAYRNLTYKHIMGLKWALSSCKNIKYIIKMDDDILVNMYELVDVISKNDELFETMGFIEHNMRPKRLQANKWYVTYEEYPKKIYPPFLSGWLYVISTESARKIVSISDVTKYFWIDDVFVTGILARKVGIKHTDIGNKFAAYKELIECCLKQNDTNCDYMIGPSGGEYEMQIEFEKLSKNCYINKKCKKLSKGSAIDKKCVVEKKPAKLGKGRSEISVLPII